LISISDANKLGVSGLVRQAEEGRERVLLRNNKPVAAVVSMRRLEALQQAEEDLAAVLFQLSQAKRPTKRAKRLE
jgi:antitoxin (DNA-binding transcriptional repressor) of toxin-antitoxin stability system